jgi:photosystem II stability/assembly factor-like uncharacterized protein
MPMYVLLLSLLFQAHAPSMWSVQTSGIRTNLRGVSAVMARDAQGHPLAIVWACGSNGVILRSPDGGKTWQQLSVAGGEKLDFRGIQAIGAQTAYVISIGSGDDSRIYKTTDGGANWKMQFTDKRKEFFLDDIVCISETHCFVAGDPVDGKLYLASTEDGEHWKELPRDSMPPALPGEGAFAASSTTLAIYGQRDIYIGTGGPAARVFHSPDLGKTWTVANTPILSGQASFGIFSIMRSGNTLVVVGGDYQTLNRNDLVAAYSTDDGATWTLSAQQPGGFRSAVAALDGSTLVAAGPSGEDVSYDKGVHWLNTDNLKMNALVVLDKNHAWAVGERGTIARLTIRESSK